MKLNWRELIRKLAISCVPLIIFGLMLRFYDSRRVPMDRLVGTWRSERADGTFYLKFMPDGRYEELMELKDANMMGGTSQVFKGRFSASWGRIRLYGYKRYLGNFKSNVLFVPCSNSISCAGDQEMFHIDEDGAKRGDIMNVTQANWAEGHVGFSYDGKPTWIWTRFDADQQVT